MKQDMELPVLRFMKERKTELYGKMPSGAFHPRRTQTWKEAVQLAKCHGLVPEETDVKKFRDQWFTYRKRRSKGKLLKTGLGVSATLTEADHLVLDIMDRNLIVEAISIPGARRPVFLPPQRPRHVAVVEGPTAPAAQAAPAAPAAQAAQAAPAAQAAQAAPAAQAAQAAPAAQAAQAAPAAQAAQAAPTAQAAPAAPRASMARPTTSAANLSSSSDEISRSGSVSMLEPTVLLNEDSEEETMFSNISQMTWQFRGDDLLVEMEHDDLPAEQATEQLEREEHLQEADAQLPAEGTQAARSPQPDRQQREEVPRRPADEAAGGAAARQARRLRVLLSTPEEELTERQRTEVLSVLRVRTVKAHLRLLEAVLLRVEAGQDVGPLADLGLRMSGNNGL